MENNDTVNETTFTSEELTDSPHLRYSPLDHHVMTTTPVFVVEDSFFRSRTPRPIHWSIAWSDLMMTMFILFLTLFIYQLAHRHFLDETQQEVVAGTAMDVPSLSPGFSLSFDPISPGISSRKSDPLFKAERMEEKDVREDFNLQDADIPVSEISRPADLPRSAEIEPAGKPEVQPPAPPEELVPEPAVSEPSSLRAPVGLDRLPSTETATQERSRDIITEIYDLSQTALTDTNLRRYASVEVIPDKAVRIILTGDLLFDSGRADLSFHARKSLLKLSPILRHTPYMINVVGHTDTVPISSQMYPTNWELSVARASRVARFLIDEMNISEKQLVVAGYSYNRPIRPNTTLENRAANRRVELILSVDPQPAIPTNAPSNF